MGNLFSTQQGGDVTISLDSSPGTLFEPTASNFNSESKSSNYASLEEAHSGSAAQLEARPNVYAAKLATNRVEQQNFGNFSDIFTTFHDASIKITVDGNVQGSGILIRSGTSLVIVTTAHIFSDINEKSGIKIDLETGYSRCQGQNAVQCRRITIPLKLSAIKIKRICARDVAVFVLDEETKEKVFNVVETFPKASFLDEGNALFMMIHYANGDHKQVTTGRRQQNSHETLIEQLHMDGGPGASGAPIYSLSGNVVAIQKAHVHNHQEIRSLILIEDVIDTEMYECGQSYVKEALVEAESYEYQYNPNMWVDDDQINPFEINEARKSQEYLLSKIQAKNRGRNRKLPAAHLNKKGLPKISSPSTFDLIETKHPGPLAKTVYKCLGRGGKHGQTKEWSLKGKIESDHFPPFDAYVKALHLLKCKKEVKARINSNRRRDNLPAITIPYNVHRGLDTTGNDTDHNEFRKEQAESIGQGKFVDAIEMNLGSYRTHGLFTQSTYPNLSNKNFRSLLKKYYVGFKNALQEHVNLKFINPEEKDQLLATLRTVIKEN